MSQEKGYYMTDFDNEIRWLKRGGFEKKFIDEAFGYYCFEKSPALFISLANFYNQYSLQREFNQMDNAFSFADCVETIDLKLLPNNPLINGGD